MRHGFRHLQHRCHPERSEGAMHSVGVQNEYIGPSRKNRAQDDKENLQKLAVEDSLRSCG
jgi:hypothetical protein